MGRMDEDGYVMLQDRSRDMIISGGSYIYPREVEEVLLSHPNVHEVAVIGQPHADRGDVVVAVFTPAPRPRLRPVNWMRLAWTTSLTSSGPRRIASPKRCQRTITARS